MKDYINKDWSAILQQNGLNSFDDIWRLDTDWFEPPNKRRGGWSGVSRFELETADHNRVAAFLKRQENHFSRTLLHPFKGIPTFVRELRNILRLMKRDIPTLDPIYLAQRKIDGVQRAILMTEELTGFRSLQDFMLQWQTEGWPDRELRQNLMRAVAGLMRRMNQQHMQHNCFYPKHIFLKFTDDKIDIRIIDLEKAKWRPLTIMATLRDLYTLNRHTPTWSRTDRLRFFLLYLQIDALTPRARRIWRQIARRTIKKGHLKDNKNAATVST